MREAHVLGFECVVSRTIAPIDTAGTGAEKVGDGFAQHVTARAGMQVTIIFGGFQPLSLTPIQRLFKSSAHVHEYNA